MYLLGVDVGGTFTDFVIYNKISKSSIIFKSPTTTEDPSIGIINGINELCIRAKIDPTKIDYFFHGTTTATNAILEYDGAECGMITNKGFKDIIHIGRHQRPQSFSIQQEIPWQDRPLIKRRFRKTVSHRIVPPKGQIIQKLDETEIVKLANEFTEKNILSIAVCFLFSYLDPSYEEKVKKILLETNPKFFVTTSSSLIPQFREFERFTTAAINAFVGPKVEQYIENLRKKLGENKITQKLYIMSSNGGVSTVQTIRDKPVLTLLSGPAAGILGGSWIGKQKNRKSIITFDVGGTSADIGIINNGKFSEATPRDTWISGYPLMMPMLDIHTIGAGGGSIAFLDSGGSFKVGPRSAGAKPGPAAYGLGGKNPTVTDANLVLGRLIPKNFLNGEMTLSLKAAEDSIQKLGTALNLTKIDVASGILKVINSNMANAIRSRTVQKGLDPREFVLVAFGGAGPLQACDVASILAIPEVIIPRHPGITSAIGLLTTDLQYDLIKTAFQISGKMRYPLINKKIAEMKNSIWLQFKKDCVDKSLVKFNLSADMRYVGQGYELNVPIDSHTFSKEIESDVLKKFEKTHLKEYGRSSPGASIEIVNLRIVGIGKVDKISNKAIKSGYQLKDAFAGKVDCFFNSQNKLSSFKTSVFQREKLPTSVTISGPAIVVQHDTTTVIRPEDKFIVDSYGNIIISIAGRFKNEKK